MLSKKYKYFDPILLSKLQNLKLAAGKIVDGFTMGLHRSNVRGFNTEFSQHRQYMPYDEIKNIDWKIYAKTDKFYVKEFEEDTNFKVYILLDCSTSMLFKPPDAFYSKFDYACFLVIALSYIILKQQDSIGLITFSNKVIDYIPPSSNISHFKVLLDTLEKVKHNKQTKLSGSFTEIASKLKKRGLIIVISDFYDDENEVLKSLKHFKHLHHEVSVFHLVSDFEIELPKLGETRYLDLEDLSEVITNAEAIRNDYKKIFNAFINEFKSNCLLSYIDYNFVLTTTEIDKVVNKYLSKRMKL